MKTTEEVEPMVREIARAIDRLGIDRVRLYHTKTYGWVLRWKQVGMSQYREEVVITSPAEFKRWRITYLERKFAEVEPQRPQAVEDS